MLRHIGDELELQVCPPDNGSHVTVMLDKNKGSLGLRIKESTEGILEEPQKCCNIDLL